MDLCLLAPHELVGFVSASTLALPIHRSLRFCMLRPLHDLGACDHPVFFTALRTVTFANELEGKGRMNGAYAPTFTVRAG
jgi:hypothetical protein